MLYIRPEERVEFSNSDIFDVGSIPSKLGTEIGMQGRLSFRNYNMTTGNRFWSFYSFRRESAHLLIDASENGKPESVARVSFLSFVTDGPEGGLVCVEDLRFRTRIPIQLRQRILPRSLIRIYCIYDENGLVQDPIREDRALNGVWYTEDFSYDIQTELFLRKTDYPG